MEPGAAGLSVRDPGDPGPDGAGGRARAARRCRAAHHAGDGRSSHRRVRPTPVPRPHLLPAGSARGRRAPDRGELGTARFRRAGPFGAGHPVGSPAHPAPAGADPGRGDPSGARSGRASGCRRRSDLAGEGEPGDPRRCLRSGEGMARRLPATAPRRRAGLARPAGLGHGDESDRDRPPGGGPPARGDPDAGPGPPAGRLARREARRCQSGAASLGIARGGRFRRFERPGASSRADGRRGRSCPCGRIAPTQGRDPAT